MNIKNIGWILALVFVFAGGFILGRSGIETPLNTIADDTANSIEQTTTGNTEQSSTKDVSQGEGAVQTDTTSAGGLSAGQRTMLESFGLDPNEVTLTPAMIACAEAKIGKARVVEIMAGATPSFMEGASLVACYK